MGELLGTFDDELWQTAGLAVTERDEGHEAGHTRPRVARGRLLPSDVHEHFTRGPERRSDASLEANHVADANGLLERELVDPRRHTDAPGEALRADRRAQVHPREDLPTEDVSHRVRVRRKHVLHHPCDRVRRTLSENLLVAHRATLSMAGGAVLHRSLTLTGARRVPYRLNVVLRSLGWRPSFAAAQVAGRSVVIAAGFTAAGFVGATIVGCSAGYDESPDLAPPKVARTSKAKTAPRDVAPAESAVVRVLYRDDWFGGVTLLGVDAKRMQAVVRLESHEPAKIAIDTIDLNGSKRVDRWEASGVQAERAMGAVAFLPLTGSFQHDLSKYAGIVDDLGPWHLRQPLAAPTFAVAAERDHILFGSSPTDGSEGDWLFAVTNDGEPRRIDHGLVASYSPVFSPDGRTVAFVGCSSSPCDYGLFLAKMNEDRPRRVAGIQRARPPMWSASGDAVLTVGGKAPERCLYRIANKSVTPKSLACVKGLEDVSFTQDPDGRTAALAGVRGVPGRQVVDVKWILLEDGSVLGTHTIDRAVGSSVVSASGLMAMPMQRGMVGAVDLVTGTSTVTPEAEGWFFGFEGARWVDDTLILLRKMPDRKGFDIVAIDVRKASGRRAESWL